MSSVASAKQTKGKSVGGVSVYEFHGQRSGFGCVAAYIHRRREGPQGLSIRDTLQVAYRRSDRGHGAALRIESSGLLVPEAYPGCERPAALTSAVLQV
eukprot:5826750-Prymnesium_polylepis.1